jgi:hypothetical protein
MAFAAGSHLHATGLAKVCVAAWNSGILNGFVVAAQALWVGR